MSRATDNIEAEVAAIRLLAAEADGGIAGAVAHDRHFARLLALLAPRIRFFIARYGLAGMREDAEQACAIGVHRALVAYDPGRARFTTFVNWLLRAELTALRRRAGNPALPMAVSTMRDDDAPLDIADPAAMLRVEAQTAARLAEDTLNELLAAYTQSSLKKASLDAARRRANAGQARPGTLSAAALEEAAANLLRETAIVRRYVLGDADDSRFDPALPLSAEEQRQITRRVLRKLRSEAQSRMLH